MKEIIGIDFDGTCVVDSFPYVGDNIGAAIVSIAVFNSA